MNEDVQLVIEEAKDQMKKTVKYLENEMARIRAGKANPRILDGISVDYYGQDTPLAQVSNINTPDATTIAIQPWEKQMVGPIEKAIMAANIGLTPVNNGELIRINIPPLTEERRKELVKQVKNEGENARISLRNSRRDANDEIKKLEKSGLSEDNARDAEAEVQKLTDDYNKKVDTVIDKKEQEIMTI